WMITLIFPKIIQKLQFFFVQEQSFLNFLLNSHGTRGTCSRKNRFAYCLIYLNLKIYLYILRNLTWVFSIFILNCAFFKFSTGFKSDFIKEKEKIHLFSHLISLGTIFGVIMRLSEMTGGVLLKACDCMLSSSRGSSTLDFVDGLASFLEDMFSFPEMLSMLAGRST
ncbi:hypothetical protein ACJX0J_016413, partial [Zea mays]